jgi:hypothetical protein
MHDGPHASVHHAVTGEMAHMRRQNAQRPLGVYDKSACRLSSVSVEVCDVPRLAVIFNKQLVAGDLSWL